MINGLCGPNYQGKDLAPQEENQLRKVTINPVGEWNWTCGSKTLGRITSWKQTGAMVGGWSDPREYSFSGTQSPVLGGWPHWSTEPEAPLRRRRRHLYVPPKSSRCFHINCVLITTWWGRWVRYDHERPVLGSDLGLDTGCLTSRVVLCHLLSPCETLHNIFEKCH